MSRELAPLLWRVARLLYINGQTTQRLVDDTTRLARAWGLAWEVLPQFDSLTCRWRAVDSTEPWQTEILSASPIGVDMHKVAQTNALISKVCAHPKPAGPTEIAHWAQTIEQIEHYRPSSHSRFVLMAGLGAAALGLIFGVADPEVLALIFVTAALGAGARRLIARYSQNLLIQPFAAALIAGLMGALASRLLTDSHVQFVEIAACMILVPGAHILNASLDLVRGRIGLGLARMTYCLLIFLAICVGLLLGLSLGGGTLATSALPVDTPLWLDIVAAGVAVAAFGAFFSLPWALLAAPVIVGMIGHGSRWLILENGGGVVAATLVACLIAGSAMTLLAHRLKLPFAALAFASVVSMMPGIFVFKLAASLVDIYAAGSQATLPMLLAAVSNGTGALMIVLAMTLGLIVPKIFIENSILHNR